MQDNSEQRVATQDGARPHLRDGERGSTRFQGSRNVEQRAARAAAPARWGQTSGQLEQQVPRSGRRCAEIIWSTKHVHVGTCYCINILRSVDRASAEGSAVSTVVMTDVMMI